MTAAHVLIIVQNLPVPLDRRVWMECQALRASGYDVSVICPRGTDDAAYSELDGVRIHRYTVPFSPRGTAGFAAEFVYCFARSAQLAVAIHAKHRIDAIQACNPPDTYFALAAPFRAAGVKFVYDQHDLCPEVYAARFARPSAKLLRGLRLLERATYRSADHVIVTNDSFKSVARARGRVDAGSITVVRSGPRAQLMRKGDERPELRRGRRFLCCWLGIMGPQDGVDLILQVAHELVVQRGRRDIGFALLGFGDCYDQLRELAVELGVDDHVEFTGRADDEMIRDYLSTADLGLSPDPKNEMNDVSTMNKTLEYMAHSLPVVAFDLWETKVSAGPAAVYASPNEPASFADKIECLLADPPTRTEMGEAGRQRIEDELSWEHSARRYVEVYDQLFDRATLDLRAPEPDASPTRL